MKRLGFLLVTFIVGCGQTAPQPIPIQQPVVPGQPMVVPGQAGGIAPAVPVAPLPPQQVAISPTTPQINIVPAVPGQVALTPTQPTVPSPQAVAEVPPAPPGADPRAAERMREYTVQMIATGYIPLGAPGADTLASNASDNFTITLNGGDCYTIAGFGGAGVLDLDAYLYSPAGRQLVRDFATDSRPIVRTCATESGQFRVRFHMYRGAGPYTYQVYRSAGSAVQASGLAGIDPVVRRRMDLFTASRLAKGFHAVPSLAGSGALSTNMTQNFSANLETGRCYSIAGFGGSGVADLDIFLYGPLGNEVARDEATNAQPVVNHCPSTPGSYTVKVKMFRGTGTFAMQGYQSGS
jgi:hypothetical protein